MDKIFPIGIILAGFIWVISCFVQGRKNALQKERICTETINAKIANVKKYHFLFCKYYSLTLNYTYNGKEYKTQKGWFQKLDDRKEISLHIDPENPNVCYLTTLKEKCFGKH